MINIFLDRFNDVEKQKLRKEVCFFEDFRSGFLEKRRASTTHGAICWWQSRKRIERRKIDF